MAALLNSASTKMVVNGVQGRKILHACGLRQGDPISPMLFVIAMEGLSALIHKAMDVGALDTFTGISPMQSVSIYADDVALFTKSSANDLAAVRAILTVFG